MEQGQASEQSRALSTVGAAVRARRPTLHGGRVRMVRHQQNDRITLVADAAVVGQVDVREMERLAAVLVEHFPESQ